MSISKHDEDIGSIIDAIRPLKLTNFVPTFFASRTISTRSALRSGRRISVETDARDIYAEERRVLREKRRSRGHGRHPPPFYAGSEADIHAMLARVVPI